MTPTESKILSRCLELQRDISENEPKPWQVFDYGNWVEQMEHGPTYSPCRWFEPMENSARVHHRRAVQKLEEKGLVTTYRRWGDRLTNIKLTQAGEKLAAKLLEESKV